MNLFEPDHCPSLRETGLREHRRKLTDVRAGFAFPETAVRLAVQVDLDLIQLHLFE
jgi:hypothetical protein